MATVWGSGTQADPWTRWDGSALEFMDYVRDGWTYYAKIGAYINITDAGDRPEGDWYIDAVNPNNAYGLSLSNYNYTGTCTSAGTVSIAVVMLLMEEGIEERQDVTLVILPDTYTHTIAYNANGGSGSMGNTTVTDTNSGNSNVTFANNGFTAPTGYHFGGWRINNTGSVYQPGNTYAVSGNSSVTAYAYWVLNTYTVTIASNDTGYGIVSPTSITNVPYGSSISVSGNTITINGTTSTATAATQTAQYSYAFSSWSNASGTITAARTITANFTRSTRSYTVTLTAGTGGTVSGGGTYTYGSTANISATPNTGYNFVQWSDGDTNASRSITVTGDVSLSATFVLAIAKTNVKVNGSWVKGSVYVKVNGSWVESKHIYINDNGTWRESTN